MIRVLALLLVVSCVDKPKHKIFYNDKVEIMSGFYKGVKGTVIKVCTQGTIPAYTVKSKEFQTDRGECIPGQHLRPIGK